MHAHVHQAIATHINAMNITFPRYPLPVVGAATRTQYVGVYNVHPQFNGARVLEIGAANVWLYKGEYPQTEMGSIRLPESMWYVANSDAIEQEKRVLLHLGYVPFF